MATQSKNDYGPEFFRRYHDYLEILRKLGGHSHMYFTQAIQNYVGDILRNAPLLKQKCISKMDLETLKEGSYLPAEFVKFRKNNPAECLVEDDRVKILHQHIIRQADKSLDVGILTRSNYQAMALMYLVETETWNYQSVDGASLTFPPDGELVENHNADLTVTRYSLRSFATSGLSIIDVVGLDSASRLFVKTRRSGRQDGHEIALVTSYFLTYSEKLAELELQTNRLGIENDHLSFVANVYRRVIRLMGEEVAGDTFLGAGEGSLTVVRKIYSAQANMLGTDEQCISVYRAAAREIVQVVGRISDEVVRNRLAKMADLNILRVLRLHARSPDMCAQDLADHLLKSR